MNYLQKLVHKLFGQKSKNSKKIVKERLQQTLARDRIDISPRYLAEIKQSMLKSLSRYMELDERNVDLAITTQEKKICLQATIPVQKIKRYRSKKGK